MTKRRAAEQLLEITDATSVREIAVLVAEAMLETDRQPYAFCINHNVGKPDYKACPLEYDWHRGALVGIDTMNRTRALSWIGHAISRGYIVSTVDRKHKPDGSSMSLDKARSRAAYHQRPKVENDDDIPF